MKVLFVAIGNRFRRDDGAALALAGRVRDAAGDAIDVIEVHDDVIRLLDIWQPRDFVIVADAVVAGGEPGTLYRRDPIAAQLPRHWFALSSHQLGVVEAIELGRTMKRLPRRMLFLGIEGIDFGQGEGLTPEVDAALTPALHVVQAAVTWALSEQSPAASRRSGTSRP